MSRGGDLRDQRLAMGRSLQDVAAITRIPQQHLEALEDDRWDELPAGPYLQAYLKSYRQFLGLTAPPVTRTLTPEHHDDRPVGRYAVGAISVAFVLVALVVVFQHRATAPPAATGPDQHVRVVARRNTQIKITVDGEVVLDRRLPGGQEFTAHGHDWIVVELPAAENVKVEYNGEALVPQGRQDAPRRLVFIDDVGQSP